MNKWQIICVNALQHFRRLIPSFSRSFLSGLRPNYTLLAHNSVEELMLFARQYTISLDLMSPSIAEIVPQKVCRIEREAIVFIGHSYEISLDRCSSHADIVAWCLHLLEKGWVEKAHLEQFIMLACHHHKLKMFI
jgi:hypothetical protein